MVTAAFAALALSRELEPLTLGLTFAAGALSFFFEWQKSALFRSRGWSFAWNAATLIAFALTVLDAVRGDALHAGVRFLCFLLVNKLWNRRASRDYLQAYVVSFLMLVAGAALSSDLSYAVCFLAYVVFATWTLTLFHLRREMEENYLLKHSDGAQSERVEVERILNSRRVVGGAFLAGTSLVSLAIFLSASVTFFLIPRIGFGVFLSHQRRGMSTVGFSDRVDLGEYGLIKDNPQVVMRVELPGGRLPGPLRLRGVSFDRYVHGHWSRTIAEPPAPLRRFRDLWLYDLPPRAPLSDDKVRAMLSGAVEQRIYLDPLDTPILFAAPRPIAFRLPASAAGVGPTLALESRGPGEVIAVERQLEPGSGRSFAVERKSGLGYTVWSDPRLPPAGALLALPDRPPPDAPALAPYLALPPDLPPRIAALARQITQASQGPFGKSVALEKYLQEHYRYTLDLHRDARYEPLEDFLFIERAGHCEYFASAMAVMLRTLGIPSRTVNGFYGGEWNPYGHYFAIRQGDAHTWVEVWLDGAGWVTFDPTPAAPGQAASAGALDSLRQLLDTARLAWFKYVIEYDLGKQADALKQLRRAASKLELPGAIGRALSPHRRALFTGAGLLILFGALYLRRRRGRKRSSDEKLPPRAAKAQHAFARAVRALERRGHGRAACETARELSRRVLAANDPAAAPFSELVDLYYAVRFGGAKVPTAELERLARQVVRPRAPSAEPAERAGN
jgi:transglutaminase-like putative cysteine protease